MDSRHDTARESFQGSLFHGWWYAKVVWLEPLAYHGWVLVRGVGADGARMGFLFGGSQRPQTALKLPYTRIDGQRGLAWNTATLVPHGGCYAYQIDGPSFSYSIAVSAYR